jgi:hypothetical protein
MMRYCFVALFAIGLMFCVTQGVEAAVEKNVIRTISVPHTPVDTVVSGDGKIFFVLTSGGKVYIYADNGTLKDVLEVDGTPEMITSSPSGDVVFLTDKESGSVQIVAVDFVQNIDLAGAAVRGDPNGVVTIAIFSDFQ